MLKQDITSANEQVGRVMQDAEVRLAAEKETTKRFRKLWRKKCQAFGDLKEKYKTSDSKGKKG